MANILVVRNDKLGDFMLAWPALSLLKSSYPESRIIALVPGYTRPLADICPWIDDVIIDTRGASTLSDAIALSRQLRIAHIDESISLYSETRTALALWLAGIRQRFGPATKIAQLFLNKRLRQKRSQSAKPEFEYNTDLVRYFIDAHHDHAAPLPGPPYLDFDSDTVNNERDEYIRLQNIDADSKLVLIHPGTGGSAINLSLEQFADIARALADSVRLHIIITAGPGELETADALSGRLQGIQHSVYHSTQGLVSFARFIAMGDLFISGSTGPLHIAGALDVPTVAFYSARRSATALRWQTLNSENNRMAFSPDAYQDESDMRRLDVKRCAEEIVRYYFGSTR